MTRPQWCYRVAALLLALSLFSIMAGAPSRAESPSSSATPGPPSAAVTTAKPRIDPSKLLIGPRNEATAPSVLSDPTGFILFKQQQYYRSMSLAIRDIKRTTPWLASFTLIGLSFGYGVFHAAGPGHGKAVVSAWLVGNGERLRRGVAIAFLSALIQAITAVALVSVLVWMLGAASGVTRQVARYLEATSYLLIAGMGFWLAWQALASRLVARSLAPALAPAGHPHHHHHDHHDHHDHHHDHHHHDHAHCDHDHGGHEHDCGHNHLPSAASLDGDWSLRRALSIALAVGIRPCTGALLVLLFSSAAGLYWAGVVSTFVMALGTALTVSAIAAIAVGSRRLALKLAKSDTAWLGTIAMTLKAGAGALLVLVGLTLFWGTLHGGVAIG
jgi:nickel/cobalt transporter (NicO) family protein